MTFDAGYLDISELVNIYAYHGDLILNSLNSSIKAQSSSSLNAMTDNLRITRDIDITRKTESTTFLIKAMKLLEITSTIQLVGEAITPRRVTSNIF